MKTDPAQIADLSAVQELIERDALQHLYQHAVPQIYIMDAATLRIISANAAAQNATSLSQRDLRKKCFPDLLPDVVPHRLHRISDWLSRRAEPRWKIVLPAMRADVPPRAVQIVYQHGEKPSVSATIHDTSRLVRAQEQAAAAEGTLSAAIEALHDGFALYDADDRLVMCNQTYRRTYALSAPAMVPGTRFEDILRFGIEQGQYPAAQGREDAWLRERLDAHRRAGVDLVQELPNDTWLRIVEQALPDGGRVGLRIDVSELKRQQRQLEILSRTDELTGLRNRRDLAEEIASLLAARAKGERFALMHFDLDKFNKINDMLGHEVGDQILCRTGEILSGGPRPPLIVARIGGDEFVAVQRFGSRAQAAARAFAGTVLVRIAESHMLGGQSCTVSASVGIAMIDPAKPDAARAALAAASLALHDGKSDGPQQIRVFRDEMRAANMRENTLARELHLGLTRGEFEPHYQPQVNARTGEVMGFEALIRWQRRDGKNVPADEFLRSAQKAGLTEALDDIVMEKACQAVAEMRRWGVRAPCISLNMSMAQISDPKLVKRLTNFMRAHDVSHRNIRIELLESTLLDERTANIVANVHAMIAAGFRVELDDFGTGHAAIATLRKFSVSKIKIDRSLVRHIDTDKELQTITAAIIDLARSLDIAVLAEGVETIEEQEVLLKFDCDAAQGYLHAKPMPLPEVQDFLIARRDLPGPPV